MRHYCIILARTVVLVKTLESSLDCKEIKPVNPKGNQSWIFIERTDAEAETPILWLPDVKNWLIWKDPEAGKDWSWEEKGMTEMDGHLSSIHLWMDDRLDGITDSWVGVSSRSSWWIGRLHVLQSTVSQRVGHNWATKVNWGKLWAQNHCLNKYVHV